MEGYGPSTYGDRFADVYDDWYGDVTDATACASQLATLARDLDGPVLELGIGSGRVALPLAALGVEVHGIDASSAMVERLRAKPGSDAIHVTTGDMADLEIDDPPPFAVVFVAFNTFFNLATPARQQRCFERVRELLAPGGRFVVEAFVPRSDIGAEAGGSVTPRRIAVDEVVLTVSQVDPETQTITGQHVHLRERGIRLRPWHLRYAPPEELDAMAAAAGLDLEARSAGWSGEPFTDRSEVHVSTYRRGNVPAVLDHPPAAR